MASSLWPWSRPSATRSKMACLSWRGRAWGGRSRGSLSWRWTSPTPEWRVSSRYLRITCFFPPSLSIRAAHRFSKEGGSKVQLQLVEHDGSTTNLHFTGDAAKGDRAHVSKLLLQLDPHVTQQAGAELETKKALLQSDQTLHQLYRDLVMLEIILADEFWARRLVCLSVCQWIVWRRRRMWVYWWKVARYQREGGGGADRDMFLLNWRNHRKWKRGTTISKTNNYLLYFFFKWGHNLQNLDWKKICELKTLNKDSQQ